MLPYWRLSAYYFSYFAFIGAFSPYFGLYYQSLGFSAWEIGVLMSLTAGDAPRGAQHLGLAGRPVGGAHAHRAAWRRR